MIHEVMQHIRNYFPTGKYYDGTFEIKNGTVELPFLIYGQYFLIEDSVLNNGVYQYPAYGLYDEKFTGTITPLSPPREFVDLVNEIEDWKAENASKINSPYSSESFGGYTYQKATGKDGDQLSWKDVFGNRLNAWRKI